jgi:hypothetical protein
MLGTSLRRFRRRPPAGLVVAVVVWWLLLAGAIVWLMPEPAASASSRRVAVVPGQTARLHQPGMPSWPIPVERAAFDEARRGFLESDEILIERAFATSEWLAASHGQAVSIVAVDGEAVQVELLEGPDAGRRAWVQPRHLGPSP